MNSCRAKFKLLVSDTAPLYPPLWGGPIRIWNLFANLPEEFEVIYVSPLYRFGAKYNENQIKPNLKEISVPITKLYYPFRYSELKFLKGITFELFSYLFMSFDLRFKRTLNDQDADILISSHPWSFPCLKKKRKNQILVYDAHNCEYLLMKAIAKRRWYKSIVCLLVKIIERYACRKSDIVLVCSKEDAKVFINLYKISENKIYYAPNGTSIKPYISNNEKVKIKEEFGFEKIILFIGTYFNPNIEAARFIIEHLSKELDDCTFLIVGWVKWAFKDNNLPKNIRLLGRIDDSELYKIMSISDLAINPMSSGSGINIKVLDYLSAGLPVVTTPIGARGIDAINGKHMIITELKDFSKNVRKLLDDKDLCEKLRANGRKLIEEKFVWPNIRDTVAQILKDKINNEVSLYNYSKSQ